MNRRHLAIAALLAAALAALVWLTLFRGDDVSMERSVAPPAAAANLGSPAAAAGDALEAPAPSEAPTRVDVQAPTEPVASPSESPSAPSTRPVLEVHAVERETRAPVEGVRIEFPERRPPDDAPSTTDANGIARVDGVESRGLLLRMVPPAGFALAPRSSKDMTDEREYEDQSLWVVYAPPDGDPNTLVVELVPAGRVEGFVTCAGVPATTWSVLLESCADRSLVASTTTDERGHYVFASTLPGNYRVRVDGPVDWDAPGAVDACARPARPLPVVTRGRESVQLDIEMYRTGRSIRGAFVDQMGRPAAGLIVTCLSAPADHVLTDELWSQGVAASGGDYAPYMWLPDAWPQKKSPCAEDAAWFDISTRTRADGTFSFDGLDDSWFQLAVEPSGRPSAEAELGVEFEHASFNAIVDLSRFTVADVGTHDTLRVIGVELDLTFVDASGAVIDENHALADARLECDATYSGRSVPLAKVRRPWRMLLGHGPGGTLLLDFSIVHAGERILRFELDPATFEYVDGRHVHATTIRVP